MGLQKLQYKNESRGKKGDRRQGQVQELQRKKFQAQEKERHNCKVSFLREKETESLGKKKVKR